MQGGCGQWPVTTNAESREQSPVCLQECPLCRKDIALSPQTLKAFGDGSAASDQAAESKSENSAVQALLQQRATWLRQMHERIQADVDEDLDAGDDDDGGW